MTGMIIGLGSPFFIPVQVQRQSETEQLVLCQLKMMTTVVSIYTCITLILVSNGFPLQCPNVGHTYLRARSLCGDKPLENYACLFDTNHNVSIESCISSPDYVPPGQHYVLSGSRRNINCPLDKYQPIPLWVNESGQCLYKKSTCAEDGLIVHGSGSPTKDRTCRCDYTRGYSFVSRPQKRCFCFPAEEDCTCYIVNCPVNTRLNSDYECSEIDTDGTERNRCDPIHDISDITLSSTTMKKDFQKDHTDHLKISDITKYILISVCTVMLMVLAMVCRYLQKYPIQLQNSGNSTAAEQKLQHQQDDESSLQQFSPRYFGNIGDKLTIYCPVTLPSSSINSVEWLANNNGNETKINEFTENANYHVTRSDNPSLTVYNLGTSHTGSFICKITTGDGKIVCAAQELLLNQGEHPVKLCPVYGIARQDITLRSLFRLESSSNIFSRWRFLCKDKKVEKLIDAISSVDKYEISTHDTFPSITIKDLQPDDNGTYICISQASFGNIHCYPIHLLVIGGIIYLFLLYHSPTFQFPEGT